MEENFNPGDILYYDGKEPGGNLSKEDYLIRFETYNDNKKSFTGTVIKSNGNEHWLNKQYEFANGNYRIFAPIDDLLVLLDNLESKFKGK